MTSMNILHIEDDFSDATLIKQLLQRASNSNFRSIKNVPKLPEGLKELQTDKYDVVLLDLGLADVTGIDNLKCVRDENPEIPIIVLTGNDSDTLAEEALIETIKISASIGIAMFPGDGETYSDLIEAADNAMYMAKKNNGVKYAFAEPVGRLRTLRYLH